MDKAILHIKGQVAEVVDKDGELNAKIICDTNHLLISLNNIQGLEFGEEVMIEGEIQIKSIRTNSMVNKI